MHNFFEGWYMKCQSDTHTFAVIPAIHEAGQKRSCSVQLITEENAWNIEYPAEMFCKRGKKISIQNNMFSPWGIRLCMNTPDLRVRGKLTFGPLEPLNYDIMGPFAMIPFMECRHSVFSMKHRVDGSLLINDEEYVFRNAIGYWEGDRGRSFPKEYLWTQCHFSEGSIMLSIAEIPVVGRYFSGIIGIVFWQGKEYRFATYLGAKVICLKKGVIRVVQRDMELEVKLLEPAEKTLSAPKGGDMIRNIRESLTCHAYYQFKWKGATFFEFETYRASFEYEYCR